MYNTTIEDIIKETNHRPWKLPNGKWQFYQEWNDVLFIHFQIEKEILDDLVPHPFSLVLFDGKCYISVVAFKMQNIRPRNLPAISFISDFYEINVRTYIDIESKKGVYFLNIEASKTLSAFVARSLSGLPYEKSILKRDHNTYYNQNIKKNYSLLADFEPSIPVTNRTDLDIWLTERYCLYLDHGRQNIRYEIHHKPWDIQYVKVNELKINYPLSDSIHLTENNLHSLHYSNGVQVVSWNSEIIDL